MKRVKELIDRLRTSEDVIVQEGGEVILSGLMADTQPQQYTVELFKPLSDEDLKQLMENSRNPFPEPLADFYRLTNGAFFFGRHISIYGMPLWSAQYKQPLALAFEDAKRPLLCPKERLFFAAYTADSEIRLFFDTKESAPMKVYAVKKGNKVIAQWPSFEDWLLSEYEKYQAKYQRGEFAIEEIAGVLKEIKFNVEL